MKSLETRQRLNRAFST